MHSPEPLQSLGHLLSFWYKETLLQNGGEKPYSQTHSAGEFAALNVQVPCPEQSSVHLGSRHAGPCQPSWQTHMLSWHKPCGPQSTGQTGSLQTLNPTAPTARPQPAAQKHSPFTHMPWAVQSGI